MARHDPRQARFGPDLYAHRAGRQQPRCCWPKRHRWAPARTLRRRQGRAIRKERRFWPPFVQRHPEYFMSVADTVDRLLASFKAGLS